MSILSINGYLVGKQSKLSYEEKTQLLEMLLDAFDELSKNSQRRLLRTWNGGLGSSFDQFQQDLSFFVDCGDYDHVSTMEDAANEHKQTIKRNEEPRKKA
jgi:hypothetical protein